jgi:hypothetical protein
LQLRQRKQEQEKQLERQWEDLEDCFLPPEDVM